VAHDYAPKQFLRQVKISLLRDYFNGLKALGNLEWDELEETKVEPIYEAWQILSEQTREEIEWDFRKVHEMATGDGVRAIIEEARFHGLDLTSDLDAQDGYHNKAFWTMLVHPNVFDIAQLLNRADHLNRKYWRKRMDLPKKDPDISDNALRALEDAVSAYFRENQGRGRRCKAETYLRGDRYHYLFLYPQDHTDTFIGYDNEGRFQRKTQSPAFEVIYIYDLESGTLDLYVRGDKKLVTDLQKIFGREILHEELKEEKRTSVPYDLNGLKDRNFSFPTDPADSVKSVKVNSMRFSLRGSPRKRITFEIGPTDPKEAIYELIETALNERQLPLSMVNVTSVVIQMIIEQMTGKGRDTKTVSFRVSLPNSCNLKDSPGELVAKKYLKEWKIERS